ncbi:MAG: phosphoenolpyruvate carboxykinase [Dehalococcoidales bacterium]|nr:phosphoenolpyruvate carboxykinase [Dehalococcoidales bacterium]
MTNHSVLSKWVEECAELCQPDGIVYCDGSEAERERLEREAIATGELIQLNQEKLPGCVYHRTSANDVARTEHLTFICSTRKEDAGPTNNWMNPEEAYQKARAIFRGSMRGRTMYVVPFSMGPLGSPFSKFGVELTDSIYVVLNMRIMTRMGKPVLEALGTNGEFTKCLHGLAELDINKRLILQFPEDNTIWSVGSGYGGNVLLGKKCLSLRIASYLGRQEGWLAEHMFIMGIQDPQGKMTYVAGAFPSSCGKTNLAMLIPPDVLRAKGFKVVTVGDDIAWMRIKEDGRLWAVNPETGFFGVAPGTNWKTNPNAMATIRSNTIYTNVLLKQDKTVWWEDGDGPPPVGGLDWQGNPWRPGSTDKEGKIINAANPNSRYTAPAAQCPCIAPNWEDPEGVPISAFIVGGRRAQLTPLVYESRNWQHGVFVGATLASERTAAQYGKIGEARRDPMAMLPFCGYNMADYFGHWFETGKKLTNPPKLFQVNWFRTDENGKFLWPGFGENLRVLDWIVRRCQGKAEAKETPIGYVPTLGSLDMEGLDIQHGIMEKLLSISAEDWKEELKGIKEFFDKFEDRLPQEMWDEYRALARRLGDKG